MPPLHGPRAKRFLVDQETATKPARFGRAGAERLGIVVAAGAIRDASSSVVELDATTTGIAPWETFVSLEMLDQLPPVGQEADTSVGPCSGGIGRFVCLGLNVDVILLTNRTRTEPMPDYVRVSSHDVGAIRVTTVADGISHLPLPAGFVANADTAEVSAAMQAAGVPAGQLELHYNPVLLESAQGRVLIDTGFGEAIGRKPDATTGLMRRSMALGGIEPDSIDMVVISHFHPDHVNGLLLADGSPAFPRAKLLVPEPEWSFWMDDACMRAATGRAADAFAANRSIFASLQATVIRYSWDDEVFPGLTARATPGHTPGHTSFDVRSAGRSLFIQSDVSNHPGLFVVHPDWRSILDMDGVQAAMIRRRVYDRLADEKITVQGFHFPFPGYGTIERHGDGYRLVSA